MLRADNRHQNIAKPADNKRIGYLSAISVDYDPDRALPAASMAAWAEAVVRGWRGDLMGDGLHLAPPLAPAPLHACDGFTAPPARQVRGQKKTSITAQRQE